MKGSHLAARVSPALKWVDPPRPVPLPLPTPAVPPPGRPALPPPQWQPAQRRAAARAWGRAGPPGARPFRQRLLGPAAARVGAPGSRRAPAVPRCVWQCQACRLRACGTPGGGWHHQRGVRGDGAYVQGVLRPRPGGALRKVWRHPMAAAVRQGPCGSSSPVGSFWWPRCRQRRVGTTHICMQIQGRTVSIL
jgi:hypothetical protein